MKNRILILLLVIVLIPFKVFASGGFSVSTGSVTMYPGESKTISISSDNSVGKLNISSANSEIVSVSTGSIFIQTPGSSESFTISAGAVGTTTVSVVASSDFATMDEEILAGQTKNITVNVINRPTENNNNNSNNNNNNLNQVVKSSNNNIKEISIDGFELEKVDNNNYKLSVKNNITSINISAIAEDIKATVTGTGTHELSIGDNTIAIIITSESGSQNKINITVTRKDGYYLEDMTDVFKDTNITDININISKDSQLSKEQLEQIKESGKVVSFNYYDENSILKYSWMIDGSKILKTNELQLNITNETTNFKIISELSNYASGMYLNFEYSGDLPSNTKIKYFVGDEYNDNDKVNLYYYNKEKNKLEKTHSNLIVKDGYIEFEIEHCSDYFLSMTDINNTLATKSFNWFIVISIIEFVLLVGATLYYIIKIKNNRDGNNRNNNDNNMRKHIII